MKKRSKTVRSFPKARRFCLEKVHANGLVRLEANGVLKLENPLAQAVRQGRFEELDRVYCCVYYFWTYVVVVFVNKIRSPIYSFACTFSCTTKPLAAFLSRRVRRKIFPLALLGTSSTNSTSTIHL